MTKLNVEQICSIKIYRKSVCRWYAYKEFKRSFWGKVFRNDWGTKEGFYHLGFGSYIFMPKERIEKDPEIYCEGKKVFYFPHIDIKMINSSTFTKYFKTEDEVDFYIDCLENINGVNFIEI